MAIALDADTVYFATGPSGGENGTIARVSKQGGESRVLVERRNTILSMAVDDGRVVWSENGNLAAAVSSDGGPVVELHRRDDPSQVTALVSQGIAAAGGSVYFGVGRQNAALRASARDGSSRDVETMSLPSNANAFIATSIAVDEARVYWFDYWWSYSSPKHQAIVRSAAR